jgi:rhodanese-related sulfurtransferase
MLIPSSSVECMVMSTELSPEALMTRLAGPRRPLVIDVRKPEAFRAEPTTIPGAIWRDPFALADWSGELPGGRSVVVYCVHGHEVSRSAQDALRRQGFEVDLLAGGLEGWKAAGGRIVPASQGERP